MLLFICCNNTLDVYSHTSNGVTSVPVFASHCIWLPSADVRSVSCLESIDYKYKPNMNPTRISACHP